MKYKTVNEKSQVQRAAKASCVRKKARVISHHVSEQLLFLCSKDGR